MMEINKEIITFVQIVPKEALKRLRELVPDVNMMTSTATSSKEERRKKMKKVTEADEFSEEGN